MNLHHNKFTPHIGQTLLCVTDHGRGDLTQYTTTIQRLTSLYVTTSDGRQFERASLIATDIRDGAVTWLTTPELLTQRGQRASIESILDTYGVRLDDKVSHRRVIEIHNLLIPITGEAKIPVELDPTGT